MDTATQQLIDEYETPAQVIERLKNLPVIILTGITGAGKNTIMNDMLNDGRFQRVVTSTTRAPREEHGVMEQHGVAYYFLSVDEAKANIANGEYIEVANVHGRINGSLIREYERIADSGKIALTDIDYQGAQRFLDFGMNKLTVLFIVPPSYEVWIERVNKRNNLQQTDPEEFTRRLQSAKVELEYALAHEDFVPILNNLSADSADEITLLAIHNQLPSDESTVTARRATQELLRSIDEHLSSTH